MRTALALSALACFSPLPSLASPAVGDRATYEGTVVTRGVTTGFRKTQELTAYNAASGEFRQVETTVHDGKAPVVEEQWIEADSILSDTALDALLSGCAAGGGVIETITVPAGRLRTCRVFESAAEAVNHAKVPFGVARTRGESFAMELVSYRTGG